MLLTLIFIPIVFASEKEFDDDFFPTNKEEYWNTLIKYGTWLKECNGKAGKALLHFPIKKVPDSVCDSLEPLGFSQGTKGKCSRSPLVCHDSQNQIQWTNNREKDHFTVDFDWDIIGFETTLFKNSSLNFKFGSRAETKIKKVKDRCAYYVLQIWKEVDSSCGKTSYNFGFVKTYSFIYEYIIITAGFIEFTRLNISRNEDRVDIIQDGASLLVTKMNLSLEGSQKINTRELDHLHRMSDLLKNYHPWNCGLLYNCQVESMPSSGQLDLKHNLVPEASIYLSFHVESIQTLNITQDDGNSHQILFIKNELKLKVKVPDVGSRAANTNDHKVDLLMVIHHQTIMILLTSIFQGTLAYEFVIPELVIERVQSFQIQPNVHQMDKEVLISIPGTTNPSFFPINPALHFFSTHMNYVITVGVMAIVLAIMLLCIYFLQQRSRFNNVPTSEETNSCNECSVNYDAQGDQFNEEYYYSTNEVDYYV